MLRWYCTQYQLGCGHAAQQHGPQRNDGVVDFAVPVKTTKSDIAVFKCRQCVDGWGAIVGFKNHRSRQISELLYKLPIQFVRWYPVRIAEVVIHGLQTRGTQVAQPADLKGCWFACKRQQSIFSRVTRQVEQNINAVRPHLETELVITRICNCVPVRKVSAHTSSHLVFRRICVVSVQR